MSAETDVPVHHEPVLRERVIELLEPAKGETIVDATVGLGGHAAEIAKRLGPEGRLIGIDQDAENLKIAGLKVQDCRTELVHGNFADLEAILTQIGIETVDGLLADLGVSSPQLEDPQRGFSFRLDGPLDMRMDQSRGEPASRLVNRLSAWELANIFWELGEERHSRRIARRIVEERSRGPVRTTTQLAQIVRSALPRSGPKKGKRSAGSVSSAVRIDPATRVFQALRIAVNDELGALDRLLEQLPRRLRTSGRAVVISFHSLEDRRVKRAFRDREIWQMLTKKPLGPSDEEIHQNPRARSAKLRAVRRLGNEK